MDERREESETRQLTITDQKDDVIHHLNEYRRSNHLCDVTIIAGGREFPAHRAVLAAGDRFFNGLFATNMRERSENKIELLQVDPDVVDDVLGYIYTAEIKLTQENAQLVAMAADFLLLDKLKSKVDDFLAHVVFKEIPITDIMSVYYFANRIKCDLLEKMTLKVIQRNFETIATKSHEEFLELDAEGLEEIISSNDLEVNSEEIVFRAVVDWVQYKEERRDSFYKLFGRIRMCSLSKEFIQSCVTKEDLVSTSPDCLELIRKHLDTTSVATLTNIQHPRHCLDPYTDAVFVCSLINTASGSWCYIPSDNSWYKYPNMLSGSSKYCHALYFKGVVFFLTDHFVVVSAHDLETHTSLNETYLDDYYVSNYGATCLHVDGMIYIIGGTKQVILGGRVRRASSSEVFALDISEVHTISSKTFQHIASMNSTRQGPLVVNDDNYIYALGGRVSLLNDTYTCTVERYDPASDAWDYVSPMNGNRSAFECQCVAANGKIFVIQVMDEVRVCKEKYDLVYDIKLDTWSRIPLVPTAPPFYNSLKTLASCEGYLYYLYGECYEISRGSASQVKLIRHDVETNTCSGVVSSVQLKVGKRASHVDYMAYWSIDLAGVGVRLRKDMIATLGKPLSQDKSGL